MAQAPKATLASVPVEATSTSPAKATEEGVIVFPPVDGQMTKSI